MVTFCAEPFPNYPACLYNCIVAGPGSDDEGPSAIFAFFLDIPVKELDRRRPGGREHRRQRRMSLSCLPFPPGALQLYGGKGSSFLCSSRRLDSRPVRSTRKRGHRRREAVSFLFRKPKNNNARFCRNLQKSKMPDYNDSFHPPLEMLLRDLELKAATEKAITCAEIVELRSQIKKCFEQN